MSTPDPTRLGRAWKLFWTIGLATVLLAPPPAAAAPPDVYGGDDASPGDFPFMVALVANGAPSAFDGQFCGGTLVRARWVLTAAHCVDGADNEDFHVIIGRTRLNGSGGESRRVVQIVVHPDYAATSESVYNDLALLRLRSLATKPRVGLAALAQRPLWEAGDHVTAVGWGQVEDGTFPDVLQRASVRVVGDGACSGIWSGIDPTLHVCAGGTARSVCIGDSGGPLLVPLGSSWRQIGVVSYGAETCRSGVPDVYTQVGTNPLRVWILSETS